MSTPAPAATATAEKPEETPEQRRRRLKLEKVERTAKAAREAQEELAAYERAQADLRGRDLFVAVLRSLPRPEREMVFTALIERLDEDDPRRAGIEAWEASLPEPVKNEKENQPHEDRPEVPVPNLGGQGDENATEEELAATGARG